MGNETKGKNKSENKLNRECKTIIIIPKITFYKTTSTNFTSDARQ
jgi:hypothetical protein